MKTTIRSREVLSTAQKSKTTPNVTFRIEPSLQLQRGQSSDEIGGLDDVPRTAEKGNVTDEANETDQAKQTVEEGEANSDPQADPSDAAAPGLNAATDGQDTEEEGTQGDGGGGDETKDDGVETKEGGEVEMRTVEGIQAKGEGGAELTPSQEADESVGALPLVMTEIVVVTFSGDEKVTHVVQDPYFAALLIGFGVRYGIRIYH